MCVRLRVWRRRRKRRALHVQNRGIRGVLAARCSAGTLSLMGGVSATWGSWRCQRLWLRMVRLRVRRTRRPTPGAPESAAATMLASLVPVTASRGLPGYLTACRPSTNSLASQRAHRSIFQDHKHRLRGAARMAIADRADRFADNKRQCHPRTTLYKGSAEAGTYPCHRNRSNSGVQGNARLPAPICALLATSRIVPTRNQVRAAQYDRERSGP